MSNTSQPVAGSLEAKIIRACPVHRKCHLQCPERRVEELGQIASFDLRPQPTETGPSLFERAEQWFARITHKGGP